MPAKWKTMLASILIKTANEIKRPVNESTFSTTRSPTIQILAAYLLSGVDARRGVNTGIRLRLSHRPI